MANPSAPVEHDLFLSFNKHSVRIVMFDGVPYFALSDICDAAGLNGSAATVVDRPDFPEHAKRTVWEETDEGLQDATLLSPVGVHLFTTRTDPARLQRLSAWARSEAKRLCPNPREGDPAMFLTLGPDGSLPPCPMRYTGRRFEWDELRFSPEYFAAQAQAAEDRSQARRELQARFLAEAEAARLATTQETAA